MAEFTSWAAIRADIKNQIATLAAGDSFLLEYQIGDFRKRFRSIDELKSFYRATYELEALDDPAGAGLCVSYGRPRRFGS